MEQAAKNANGKYLTACANYAQPPAFAQSLRGLILHFAQH
jgi:hypothetical protein